MTSRLRQVLANTEAHGVTVASQERLDDMSGYTETDVRRLGERFDALDLADGEQAALEALIGFAARNPGELVALSNRRDARFQAVLPEILFDA